MVSGLYVALVSVLKHKLLLNLCTHRFPYAIVIGNISCTLSPLSLQVDSHLLLPRVDEKFSRSLQHEPGSTASALRLPRFRLREIDLHSGEGS